MNFRMKMKETLPSAGFLVVYRKPPARRVVPKSLRLYILVESGNPLIKFATRSDHLHNK